MKAKDKKDGFLGLSRQASMILACGTSIWCLISGVSLLESLFRSAVVYLTMVIISYVISNMIARIINESETLEFIETPSDAKNDNPR